MRMVMGHIQLFLSYSHKFSDFIFHRCIHYGQEAALPPPLVGPRPFWVTELTRQLLCYYYHILWFRSQYQRKGRKPSWAFSRIPENGPLTAFLPARALQPASQPEARFPAKSSRTRFSLLM